MNTTRRETVGPVKVNLGFHEATVAVVCQEGCYPDKKAHVNQDCFACKPLFHEEGDAAKHEPEIKSRRAKAFMRSP